LKLAVAANADARFLQRRQSHGPVVCRPHHRGIDGIFPPPRRTFIFFCFVLVRGGGGLPRRIRGRQERAV
jgi:hypothetical protein